MKSGTFALLALSLTAVLFSACAASPESSEIDSKPPVGQAPAPTAAPILTSKGQQGSTQIKPNDPDAGDSHTFHVTADGEHGKVYVSAQGMVVYIPSPEFAGGDRFQITVADSQGVTAATWVAAAVRFAPADPTASADILTYKNTPAAYVVFAPEGVPSAFHVATAPAHGSAEIDSQGILTYTPAEGFSGDDSIDIEIALMGGGTTSVAVSVNVANRAPAPSATGIFTTSGKTGVTSVHSGDPDVRESLVYSIETPPANGTATVDAGGLLSYTPSIHWGTDLLYVRVTDGSAASATAPVLITIHLPAPESALAPEFCNDGIDRVLIAKIDPEHGTALNKSTPVTATLVYSLATTTAIGIHNATLSEPITSVTVAPGCGSVSVAGILPPSLGGTYVTAFPGGANLTHFPGSSQGGFRNTGYWSNTIGGPVIDYFVSFHAWYTALYSRIDLNAGYNVITRADFHDHTYPVVRVWQPNKCEMSLRSIEFENGLFLPSTGTFDAANIPPAIQVSSLLTDIPVTAGKTYTMPFNLMACDAPVAVTLTGSAGWFSVSTTTVTLNTSAGVTFEVDADLLPASDTLFEGTLRIHPVDNSFADIDIPVSAIRLAATDLDEFSPILLGAQLLAQEATVDLPWPFPFEGVTYTTISFQTDGSVCLANPAFDCEYLGLPVYGGIHTLLPGEAGGPVLVPYWTDLQAFHRVAGENESGIYWRDVTTATDPHAEFLWWDVQSKLLPVSTHNVVRMLLFPDGRFVFDYPHIQPVGLEVATWWYLLGNPGFERVGSDLKSGDRFHFDPVE